MSGEAGGIWQVEISLPAVSYLPEFDAALEELGGAVSAQEIAGGPRWRLTAHCAGEPDRAALEARIAAAAASAGIDPPPLTVQPVPDTDWVAEYRRRTVPVTVGPFFIYPTHYEDVVPAGRIGIRLDAGLAFGTGEHESTEGCLLALDRLRGASLAVRRGLDLGCGSAILAIAMARLWPGAAIVAVDSDPEAVRTSARNIVENRCADSVVAAESEGYGAGIVSTRAPYDLIAANILARPLVALAPRAAAHLAPGGRIVLSGLLSAQADEVLAAHEAAGLASVDAVRLGDWTTLVLARLP